jgi:hypothetical protein
MDARRSGGHAAEGIFVLLRIKRQCANFDHDKEGSSRAYEAELPF